MKGRQKEREGKKPEKGSGDAGGGEVEEEEGCNTEIGWRTSKYEEGGRKKYEDEVEEEGGRG